MTVREKIQAGQYRAVYPVIYGLSCAERAPLLDAYQTECERLDALFQQDSLEETGLAGHAKQDQAYQIAWRGLDTGEDELEVLERLEDLADLLDAKRHKRCPDCHGIGSTGPTQAFCQTCTGTGRVPK